MLEVSKLTTRYGGVEGGRFADRELDGMGPVYMYKYYTYRQKYRVMLLYAL